MGKDRLAVAATEEEEEEAAIGEAGDVVTEAVEVGVTAAVADAGAEKASTKVPLGVASPPADQEAPGEEEDVAAALQGWRTSRLSSPADPLPRPHASRPPAPRR